MLPMPSPLRDHIREILTSGDKKGWDLERNINDASLLPENVFNALGFDYDDLKRNDPFRLVVGRNASVASYYLRCPTTHSGLVDIRIKVRRSF